MFKNTLAAAVVPHPPDSPACSAAGRTHSTDDEARAARSGGLLDRLRENLQLALITLFAGCSIVALFPFFIYRLHTGEIPTVIGQSVVMAGLGAAVVYAWRTGDTRRAGLLVVAIATSVCGLMIIMLDHYSVWVFAVLVANFLLVDRRVATLAGLVLVLTVVLQAHLFASPMERVTFVAVAALVSLYTLIFATRTASQHQQLASLAVRDAMTRAANRRVLQADLGAAISAHRHNRKPVGLAVLEVDDFERFNDDHGQQTGDRLLADMTRVINENIRLTDRFYRFDQAEFVVLLPDTDLVGMQEVLDKLHLGLGAELGGPDGPVSVSMGATMLGENEGGSEWLARASAARRRAERAGTGQAEFAYLPHSATDLPRSASDMENAVRAG